MTNDKKHRKSEPTFQHIRTKRFLHSSPDNTRRGVREHETNTTTGEGNHTREADQQSKRCSYPQEENFKRRTKQTHPQRSIESLTPRHLGISLKGQIHPQETQSHSNSRARHRKKDIEANTPDIPKDRQGEFRSTLKRFPKRKQNSHTLDRDHRFIGTP